MDSPVNRFSGEQMILASAASDDLRHVLRGVIEATAAGGRPRYPPATGHALARAILTRNYARALLELCHLVGAAERIDRRHGYAGIFFWAVTPALSASFQARFQAGAAGAPIEEVAARCGGCSAPMGPLLLGRAACRHRQRWRPR
ncbi:MAG: hypothetical protein VXY90_10210, partial [Pseudomonadota bacterium]|nr:hypothetical protein [Pseudomonadota bacterium]